MYNCGLWSLCVFIYPHVLMWKHFLQVLLKENNIYIFVLKLLLKWVKKKKEMDGSLRIKKERKRNCESLSFGFSMTGTER